MIQVIERALLNLVELFFTFPGWIGLILLGPIAAILFTIQFQKQKESFLPGVLGLIVSAIALFQYLWPETVLKKIDQLRILMATPDPDRQPISIFETIFEYLVAPYPLRSIVEETLGVALLVYLALVLKEVISSNAKAAPAAKPNGVFSLFKKKHARPNRSTTNELGSGDFATADSLGKWLKPSGVPGDTIMHMRNIRCADGNGFREAQFYIPADQRNRHILVVAKTGGGKTTQVILPIMYNDCLDPIRSTVVIDSKPEMWQKLAGLCQKYNPKKKILLFNPLDTLRSLSWNILGKVETDTDCKLIANTIIAATDNPSARSDSPFFRNNALQILNSIMVGLLHDKNDRLSMPRIHEVVQSGNKKMCDWLEAHPHALRNTRTFVELARSGSQNADTIMSELSMRLAAWDLKAIRSTTFFDELDLETLITDPTMFVVELRESELEMLRPMANVIVTEILRFLTRRAEMSKDSKLTRPVGLVIDEFASSLGRLPDIHVKLNTLRSRNVSIVAAVQSIGQIKANYQDDADSVIAGFSTKIFIPTLEQTDAEWASKESGQMTVRFKTNSTGSNKKLTEVFASKNDSIQEQVQQRAVLTPDEVSRPSDNISTFFFPNVAVFQGFMIPYYQIPEMNKRISETAKLDPLSLRAKPIEIEEKMPEAGPVQGSAAPGGAAGGDNRAGITNTKGWTDEQIRKKLEEIKVTLEWDKTSGSARKWWQAFENENQHRVGLVLRLAEELAVRKATITEFFLAYVYSNTDNIQANLSYLDYTRLKREEERKKKLAKAEEDRKKGEAGVSDAATGASNGSTSTPTGAPNATTPPYSAAGGTKI